MPVAATARTTRRSVLHLLTVAGFVSLLPKRSDVFAKNVGSVAGFIAVDGAFPENPLLVPEAPVAFPPGSSAGAYDFIGSHWCLGATGANGDRQLLVLPAQAPHRWTADTLSRLPTQPWEHITADEFGYLWIASSSRCMRMDPHIPEQGWLDLSTDLLGVGAPKDAQITAAGIAASGAVIFALMPANRSGSASLAEIDHTDRTTVQRSTAPRDIERIACDENGDLWLAGKKSVYRRSAATDAWQRRWQLVGRLPAGNHDLSGDVMDDRFYMAGGQNAGWGYPAKPHVFRELMVFDPTARRWSIAALLEQPRFYNGTSWLDGRIWIIGGNTRDAFYNPVTLSTVEIWDPKSNTFSTGPQLPLALDNPIAMHNNGRIYCAGLIKHEQGTGPCILFSIGSGDTSWRREPDGPTYQLGLAAAFYQDSLYLDLPNKGLARFDTTKHTWSLIPLAHAMRSPQMAAYNDQIWVMGGRDIARQDQTIIYNPADGTWSNGPSLPRELAWGAGTVVSGHLMVVGGAAGRGYSNRTFYLRKEPVS